MAAKKKSSTKQAAAAKPRAAAQPDKVLVTNRSALTTKYGSNLAAVDKAVAALVAADKARGLTTMVVNLDDADAMKAAGGQAVTDATDPAQNKAAVDAVYTKYQPDYLVLLGSVDVVPHQPMHNPVYDGANDVDRFAPGDLPYACNAPYSDDPSNFIGPDRVVGRLPDLTAANDPAVLLAVLAGATKWKQRDRADYEAHLGITAKVWEKSTVLSLRNIFGAADIHTSPAEGPGWEKAMLGRRVHFVNCHGADSDPQFYGQEGSNYPVAHQSKLVADNVRAGTIAAAECCYGGQLWAPQGLDGQEPMPIAYLRSGAFGFLGSSTIAYGPADSNGDADLVCQYFIDSVLGGASLGRAALDARQRFVRGVTVLSPVNTKTLAQFSLLGDPSIHPVTAPAAATAVPPKAARAARREKLLQNAVANLRDTSITRREEDATVEPEMQSRLLDDVGPLEGAQVQSFTVAPPPLASILPPPPQTALDAGARIRVVMGRSTTPAPTPSIVAVEGREENGRIVNRRVVLSK
jgi:Peptidase family C25